MTNIDALREKYKQVEGERFFKELFERDEYLPAREVKADTVIDVGALAGEFGAYLYDKAQVIYALEPFPDHFKELSQNITEFHLDKIKPFPLALGKTNGVATLYEDARGGHVLNRDQGGTPIKVNVKTLASFMKENRIDHVNILKIDIEGGEEAVFTAEDFKDVALKIDFIIGEHLGGLTELLQDYGFIKELYDHNYVFRGESNDK